MCGNLFGFFLSADRIASQRKVDLDLLDRFRVTVCNCDLERGFLLLFNKSQFSDILDEVFIRKSQLLNLLRQVNR